MKMMVITFGPGVRVVVNQKGRTAIEAPFEVTVPTEELHEAIDNLPISAEKVRDVHQRFEQMLDRLNAQWVLQDAIIMTKYE